MVRSRTGGGAGRAATRGSRPASRPGALATGCTVAYEELSPVYSHMEPDAGLLAAYRANAEALGRRFEADDAGAPLPTLSTDMANVSLAVPTIHPLIGIEAGGAVNHQRGVRRRLRDARRPTRPCATVPWRWPGRPSTPPPTPAVRERLLGR